MLGRRIGKGLGRVALALALFVISPAGAQEPFAAYDFDTAGGLDDFFLPIGVDLCGTPLPTGTAEIDNGEVVLSTDDAFGIGMFGLLPEIVEADFPESRDMKIKTRFMIETVTQFECSIRARVGIDEVSQLVVSQFEQAYYVSVIPEFVDGTLLDGFIAISEFTACHDDIDHDEWPTEPFNGGFAVAEPGFPITPEEWYWLEVTALGDDDGGPVTISAKLWHEDDDPPASPQLTVVDADGLSHTPDTLTPETDVGVFFGLNFDQEPRPIGGTARIDDLTITAIGGCNEAPATVTRTLWGAAVDAEGAPASLYEADTEYEVKLAITDLRQQGECSAAAATTIVERVPRDWEVGEISNGGVFEDGAITWKLDLGAEVPTLTYKVVAAGSGLVAFNGEVSDTGSDRFSFVDGVRHAVDAAALAPISDFGTIQHWLILGPFTREVGGNNPGEAELVRDYLTDGALDEETIAPVAGDTIEPDYGGDAASTGLLVNSKGRNPDDIPTWIGWRDLDDDDDRIDFESVYGDVNEVMCYALTYLKVEEETIVNFGVSSDDSVHVLLDGETLHVNSIGRGALGRAYQDLPSAFEKLREVVLDPGLHTLIVKVFEGSGEHNFRIGFVDDFDIEIPGGPEEVTISLVPEVEVEKKKFRRGDANDDGTVNIADGVFILNFLFTDLVDTVPCPEATDANGDGGINISDGLFVLNFLFVADSPGPPAPGPEACGEDPGGGEMADCTYNSC